MNEKTIRGLLRGDRFITRSGPFGQHVQDYFAAKVSTLAAGLMINAVSANMSKNRVAQDHELEIPSYSHGYYDVWEDATGRWYVTWPDKKDGPDLLESVQLPTACLLCDGVRSVTLLHDDPLCIDCRGAVLDRRICDCARYGEHIPVFCTVCGAAHSTKNIESIGSRSVHGIYPDSCFCRLGWFFHDCKKRLFVKGQVLDGKFTTWTDKYEETK